jgi:N-methylhydantoinase B
VPCGLFRFKVRTAAGEPFTSSMFNYSGGMGARAEKDGLSATCYPTGVSAVPIEVLEASIPIEFTTKELVEGSGGDGQFRGWRWPAHWLQAQD